MIGGSLFYDFARVGATPAPFRSFVLSAGVVTDYVYGAGMHWQGGCGGFPCDGSGSLNEWNVIGELKAATPLGGGHTLNGYIGAGAATKAAEQWLTRFEFLWADQRAILHDVAASGDIVSERPIT